MDPTDLQRRVDAKIAEVASYAESIPGVVIVHHLDGFRLLYMSPVGLKLLNLQWEKIQNMPGEQYHDLYFNPEFAQYYLPKILDLIHSNTDEIISYFQQVRTSKDKDWDWYMTTTRILLRDDSNKPILFISVAMKIDPDHYFTAKAAKLLQENQFLRSNHDKYSRLTKREKEILKLLALGKSAAFIAEELHISVATAETHRKKIRRKLGAKSNYDLGQYAHAFDLI